jgi:hypothetical protein
MSQQMYLAATRCKIRFGSSHGIIAVEDLWDISLTELKRIGNQLNKELKSAEDDIFATSPKTEDLELQLRFDIVKDIVEIRQAEITAASEAKERAAKKQKLLARLEELDNQEIEKQSRDELIAEIEKL